MSYSIFKLTREGPLIDECPAMMAATSVDLRGEFIQWLTPGKDFMSKFNGDFHPATAEVLQMTEPGQHMPWEETGAVEKTTEQIHNMPSERTRALGSNLYMLATASEDALFLALKSVLSAEGQGVVTHFNKGGSHLKAYAVDDCHLVDVEVQVLQVDNAISKALFFQTARTDMVRLSRVFQRAVASLRFKGFCLISPKDPAGQDLFIVDSLGDFDDELTEACGDDDYQWVLALLPLIEQAQSTSTQQQWEAAVLLAETAQASPGCRVYLAGILIEKHEILDVLLSMDAPLPIQFAAAKMLAYISLCVELPALAKQVCRCAVGAGLLSASSTLVRGVLLQAAHNFRSH